MQACGIEGKCITVKCPICACANSRGIESCRVCGERSTCMTYSKSIKNCLPALQEGIVSFLEKQGYRRVPADLPLFSKFGFCPESIETQLKKILDAVYGDLRGKKSFTLKNLKKTSTIKNKKGRWPEILNTLVNMDVLAKKGSRYTKEYNTLEEWASVQAKTLVTGIQQLERNLVLSTVEAKGKKLRKTEKMRKLEEKFGRPLGKLLAELYLSQIMSTYQIAKLFDVSNATVLAWLNELEIKPEARRTSKPSKTELADLYVSQRKSTLQIAKHYGISPSTAHKWLKDYGIKTRDYSTAQLAKGSTKPGKKELEKLYIEKKLTVTEIAEKLDYPQPTIHKWIKSYGLDSRPSKEGHSPSSS